MSTIDNTARKFKEALCELRDARVAEEIATDATDPEYLAPERRSAAEHRLTELTSKAIGAPIWDMHGWNPKPRAVDIGDSLIVAMPHWVEGHPFLILSKSSIVSLTSHKA